MCTGYSGRVQRRDTWFITDGWMMTGFLKKLIINGHLHNIQEIGLATDGDKADELRRKSHSLSSGYQWE